MMSITAARTIHAPTKRSTRYIFSHLIHESPTSTTLGATNSPSREKNVRSNIRLSHRNRVRCTIQRMKRPIHFLTRKYDSHAHKAMMARVMRVLKKSINRSDCSPQSCRICVMSMVLFFFLQQARFSFPPPEGKRKIGTPLHKDSFFPVFSQLNSLGKRQWIFVRFFL